MAPARSRLTARLVGRRGDFVVRLLRGYHRPFGPDRARTLRACSNEGTIIEDKATVALLQQMEKLRVDAQRAMAKGERPTPEMEQQLDTLLAQIQGRASYQRLLVAQENFDKVMQRVNDWIMEGIERGAASPIITLG